MRIVETNIAKQINSCYRQAAKVPVEAEQFVCDRSCDEKAPTAVPVVFNDHLVEPTLLLKRTLFCPLTVNTLLFSFSTTGDTWEISDNSVNNTKTFSYIASVKKSVSG